MGDEIQIKVVRPGPGCSKILLLIIAIVFLLANYASVSIMVRYLTLNLWSGEDIAKKYLASNPWPNTPEDAVRKCFLAIEERNWNNYRDCIEPSAILSPVLPGLPGRFCQMKYVLVARDETLAVVEVSGEWHPNGLISDYQQPLSISGRIVVVQATKGVLKDFHLPLLDISLAKRGWFVYSTEAGKLPFDFSSQAIGSGIASPLEQSECPIAESTKSKLPYKSAVVKSLVIFVVGAWFGVWLWRRYF